MSSERLSPRVAGAAAEGRGDAERALRRWQVATLALLVSGYGAYYLCRSNLAVAMPLLLDELVVAGADRDVARIRLGGMASAGVLAYAFGKFAAGAATDLAGGRRGFLAGLAGASACSALFAAGGGLPWFTLAWIANRAFQSAGWPGMVKMTARWFPPGRYGAAIGILSLSYLFGDAAARAGLGALLARGWGWREAFLASAAGALVALVACAAGVRESPRDRGLPEPGAADLCNGAAPEPGGAPAGLRAVAATLVASRAFRLACVLSLGLTLLRETFNTWTPSYFNEALGFSAAQAAARSALFPLAGGVAVLLAGIAGDALGRGGRARIVVGGLAASTLALVVLAQGRLTGELAVVWVAGIAFLLLGPYSYLAGAIALDFGGKRGSATACGILDGVGYLGGVLAGDTVARAASAWGWSGAFAALAGVAGATSVAAVLFARAERAEAGG